MQTRTRLTTQKALEIMAMIAEGSVTLGDVMMWNNETGKRLTADQVAQTLMQMAAGGSRTEPGMVAPGGNNFPSRSGVPTTGGQFRGPENAPRAMQPYSLEREGAEPGDVPVRLGNNYVMPTDRGGLAA